jgi:hypothetical protein
MTGLSKRLAALEKRTNGAESLYVATVGMDGGVLYEGKFYNDEDEFCHSLGDAANNGLVVFIQSFAKTAEDLRNMAG